MRKLLPLALVLALAACTVQDLEVPEQPVSSMPAASEPAVISEETDAETQDFQDIVLVDQSYNGVHGKRGRAWLDAIGTKLVQTNATEGQLIVELSRGEKLTGWSAVGMYLAEVGTAKNGNPYPDETVYGTNLHFLAAEWRGDCHRHLAPSSSFGVLEQHENSITLDLEAVPMTKGNDGCQTGTETLNMLQALRDGLYIGFAPSDDTYHLKVTLRVNAETSVK